MQDILPPLPIGFGVQVRRVGGRRLDDCGQGRALDGGKLGGVHAEIRLGRGLDAVSAPAEINVVQVHFQNLRLAGLGLQLQGQPHFLQLAGDGLPGAQVAQLYQLLGDGAGPFGIVPGAEVGAQRAENADEINPVVLVKPQILRR